MITRRKKNNIYSKINNYSSNLKKNIFFPNIIIPICLEFRKKIIFFLIFIRIRWIGNGSHPYEKTMSSIVL